MEREQILYYAWKYKGDWHAIAKALQEQESWEKISYDGNYVTILEEEYPPDLRQVSNAPWILFYQGDITILKQKKTGILGTSHYNAYGKNMCRRITNQLKRRYTIVTGFGKGIEAIATACAIENSVIVILGSGVNVLYPQEHYEMFQQLQKKHLIISEYPKGTPPLAHHFLWRNRIFAGICDSLIVIQAHRHCKTLLMVNEAINIGVPIYCVPHPLFDTYGEGCNLLLAQGANIIATQQDIEDI